MLLVYVLQTLITIVFAGLGMLLVRRARRSASVAAGPEPASIS